MVTELTEFELAVATGGILLGPRNSRYPSSKERNFRRADSVCPAGVLYIGGISFNELRSMTELPRRTERLVNRHS